MKVLTIKEPYATFIMQGLKKIETRSWNTKYRGEIYIHAGKSKDFIKKIKNENNNEYILGQYKVDRYAWALKNVQKLDKKIPAKGKLNIWTYN